MTNPPPSGPHANGQPSAAPGQVAPQAAPDNQFRLPPERLIAQLTRQRNEAMDQAAAWQAVAEEERENHMAQAESLQARIAQLTQDPDSHAASPRADLQ